jgi:hypothetical protein
VKFTDTRNPEEVVYSPNFKVRPKVPMIAKVGAGVVVAAVVVVLLTSKKSGGNSNDPTNDEVEIEKPKLPGG